MLVSTFTTHSRIVMNWRSKDHSWGYVIGSGNSFSSGPQGGLGAHISYMTTTAAPLEGLAATTGADERVRPDPRTNCLPANAAVDGTHVSSVTVALKSMSRGSIRIQSGGVADGPIVNPNYFATGVDRQHIIGGEMPPPGFLPRDRHLGRRASRRLQARIRASGHNMNLLWGRVRSGRWPMKTWAPAAWVARVR
ncbi:hypothetical protein DL765_009036 [Monosporascus sp. GIB2]|nr:hypothetical protein DL765_009036 [Monosporascus sp. GIB2]